MDTQNATDASAATDASNATNARNGSAATDDSADDLQDAQDANEQPRAWSSGRLPASSASGGDARRSSTVPSGEMPQTDDTPVLRAPSPARVWTPTEVVQQALAERAARVVIECSTVAFRALALGAAGAPGAPAEAADRAPPKVIAEGPASSGQALLAALKELAGLPPGRPAQPQQGFLALELGGAPVELELTVVPVVGGEHAALEVCPRCGGPRGLGDLGLDPGDLARLTGILARGGGLVAITGDGRSGRSTAFAALVGALAAEGRRVVAIARGARPPHPRAVYLRLPDASERSPASWISAAMRLGPDVLALDDLDSDAALVQAVRAAVGGTLVLLVTREEDAVLAARRLEALPFERGLVAAALLGILAIRLVRKVCPGCSEPASPPIELGAAARALGAPAEAHYAQGRGCEACAYAGVLGVLPLFELVAPDDRTRARLLEGRSAHDLSALAGENRAHSIRAQAVQLAARGEIPTSELARVL